MIYARIDLRKTDYKPMQGGWTYLSQPDAMQLQGIYLAYCRHKKFTSHMPIFDSEYTDASNDVIGYLDDHDQIIAFSLIRRYDKRNAECIQFAWNYEDPGLRLGITSLQHECAIYRDRGFHYLYLGHADEYKKHMQGFEIMGPA